MQNQIHERLYSYVYGIYIIDLSQLIDGHGSVEQLGPCFDTAERATKVEVILVRLHKKAEESRFDYFAHLKSDARPEAVINEDMLSGAVARQDVRFSLQMDEK